MKKSIVALGMVLALSGCAAAADETLAAEPAALVEISPATEENAQPVEAAATAYTNHLGASGHKATSELARLIIVILQCLPHCCCLAVLHSG